MPLKIYFTLRYLPKLKVLDVEFSLWPIPLYVSFHSGMQYILNILSTAAFKSTFTMHMLDGVAI